MITVNEARQKNDLLTIHSDKSPHPSAPNRTPPAQAPAAAPLANIN
ncbi:hypothetical protein HMPREF9371_1278 [Neisseria shayeganii 871]|uniref:Uncharacterized protein n=1 Tax=Neisseria shayeganii 871 TaxID=1032488 RepID=G4CI39_9NEIS|nr:hypothetical protein HMPREF9371_1278 [Neisseria shayeganii 871]